MAPQPGMPQYGYPAYPYPPGQDSYNMGGMAAALPPQAAPPPQGAPPPPQVYQEHQHQPEAPDQSLINFD